MDVLAVWVGKLTLLVAAADRPARQCAARPGRREAVPALPAPRDGGAAAGCRRRLGNERQDDDHEDGRDDPRRAAAGADQRQRLELRPRRDHHRDRARALDAVGCPTTSPSSSSTRPGRCASPRSWRPRRTLLLNVMRDQLDRFGEIDTTAKLLGQVGRGHHDRARPQPRRRADRRARGRHARPTVTYYGVSAGAARRPSRTTRSSTAARCRIPTCRRRPSCSRCRRRRSPNTVLRIGDREVSFELRAGGPHNAQNAAGAAAMALTLRARPRRRSRRACAGSSRPSAAARPSPWTGAGWCCSWSRTRPGFGRSLKTLDTAHPKAIVIAINDDYADGRDVSWLWDVDFARAAAPRRRAAARLDLGRAGGRHGAAAALRRHRGRRDRARSRDRRCARRSPASVRPRR